MEPFIQKGGLRIGDSFWLAGNYTWPFARLICTEELIVVVLGFLGSSGKIMADRGEGERKMRG
jgi:hypothetical protein